MELIKELGFKKLPTLSEFILKQRTCIPVELKHLEVYKARDVRTMEYLLFLQQKPELWMFVPAIKKDGAWVVLEKPDSNDDYYRDANGIAYNFHEDMKQYQEALDRVLFDGWGLMPSVLTDGYYNTLEQAVNIGIELKLK